MRFVELLGSKLKQQNNKNFNEINLIFRYPQRHLWREMMALMDVKM